MSNDNSAKTYGFSLTITSQNILVTHLGMFDSQYAYPTIGLYQEHRVGLGTVGGVLLREARIEIGTGSTLEGMFRYGALDTPMLLETGSKYVLGAYYPNVSSFPIDRLVSNVYPLDVAAGFTLNTTQFRFGQNMPFPDTVAINLPYIGPTLQFKIVPEPSSLLCLATTMFLAILQRRR